jgi:hypothetical protein
MKKQKKSCRLTTESIARGCRGREQLNEPKKVLRRSVVIIYKFL